MAHYTPKTLNIHIHRNPSVLTYLFTMTILKYYKPQKYVSTFSAVPKYIHMRWTRVTKHEDIATTL